jgi:NDP-sugar pyrophosphorylase family protein
VDTQPEPDRPYVGVILSAGKGSRIDPFNTHYPKPMLPIVNKPIVEHQIEYMRALGIRDVLIVIGHLGHVIREAFGDGERLGVRIRYVEQKQTLGIAHAVMQLEKHVSAPFLLFLGDIFYVPKKLESMIATFEEGDASAVLAVKYEEDPASIQKNFSVTIDEAMTVHKVVEKPRYLVNKLKGCGMYLFGPEIFDAIRQTPRTAMRDEYELTTSIQIFIDSGYVVKAKEVVDWDYNITFPSDLLDCNGRVLRSMGLENAVAESARVHPDAELHGAVIGAGVVVERPVRIVNSILLEGTEVKDDGEIVDSILSREIRIQCGTPSDAARRESGADAARS